MNGELWTKERDAQLRKLRGEGYSSAQIAAKLGVGRGAVIGRADRLGLRPLRQPTRGAQYVQKQKPACLVNHGHYFKLLSSSPLQNVTIDQQSFGAPITLFELQPCHCRWPVNDAPYMFCGGAKQDGSSYCGHHRDISRRGVANSY